MDAAGRLAQFFDAGGELADGFVEQLRQLAVRRRLALCQPKMKGDAGEAALRAVVQVALEAPPLLVAHGDEAGARAAQLPRLGLQLGLQPPVLLLQIHHRAIDQHVRAPRPFAFCPYDCGGRELIGGEKEQT